MHEDLISFGFLIGRYLHIVAATILVGGTLFHELVVPVAIDDLTDEQKPWIFARARWAFRGIVWICAIVLIGSGVVSTYRNWYAYSGAEAAMQGSVDNVVLGAGSVHLQGAGLWWLGHMVIGVLGIAIALGLVTQRTPPRYPLAWMRIILMILLVAIFMGSATRHVRLRLTEIRLSAHDRLID